MFKNSGNNNNAHIAQKGKSKVNISAQDLPNHKHDVSNQEYQSFIDDALLFVTRYKPSKEKQESITLVYTFKEKDKFTITTAKELLEFYTTLGKVNINWDDFDDKLKQVPLKDLYVYINSKLAKTNKAKATDVCTLEELEKEEKNLKVKPKNAEYMEIDEAKVYYSSEIGKRDFNEDALIIGKPYRENNNESAIKYLQSLIAAAVDYTSTSATGNEQEFDQQGSTLTLSYLDSNGVLTTANLGDSRTFVVVFDEKGQAKITDVTYDQDPGGMIDCRMHMRMGNKFEYDYSSDECRINDDKVGNLGVSRCFGDKLYNLPVNAEYNEIDLKKLKTDKNRVFVVNSCDGLFEFLDRNVLEQWLSAKYQEKTITDAGSLGMILSLAASWSGSGDNVSEVIYEFISPEKSKEILTGIADGHGGAECSKQVAECIHSRCEMELNEHMEKSKEEKMSFTSTISIPKSNKSNDHGFSL